MISSLTFRTGYPTRIEGIRKQTITFTDRLNILLGPNGSGKSTILRTLAQSTGCGNGGWSDNRDTWDLPYEVAVDWDGWPIFYHDCHTHSEQSFIAPDYLENHQLLRSTGEKRIGLINELIDYIENRFLTYKLKRHERPTLLLDEVDNHVGFAGQSVMWHDILPRLGKKYQLIVATHSVFPLLLRKESSLRTDNVIQLSQGYDNICLEELRRAITFFNTEGDGNSRHDGVP